MLRSEASATRARGPTAHAGRRTTASRVQIGDADMVAGQTVGEDAETIALKAVAIDLFGLSIAPSLVELPTLPLLVPALSQAISTVPDCIGVREEITSIACFLASLLPTS